MVYAPILIQVYTRIEHFKNCVESLSKCRGSQHTTLYISSDAAKNEQSENTVTNIRDYCNSIKGFEKVVLFDYDKNLGAQKSFDISLDRIFAEHDRLIYTEDDNVFSSNFLEYMNGGLAYYNENPKVFSVCGYCHPLHIPFFYKRSTFVSPICSAWGIGLWKNKYMAVDFVPKGNFREMKKKLRFRMHIVWYELMKQVFSEEKQYGDALIEYHCLQNGMVNIFPVISLVKNMGNDGSGVHCGINRLFSEQKLANGTEFFKFSDDLKVNTTLMRYHRWAIDRPFQDNGLNFFYDSFKREFLYEVGELLSRYPQLKQLLKRIKS